MNQVQQIKLLPPNFKFSKLDEPAQPKLIRHEANCCEQCSFSQAVVAFLTIRILSRCFLTILFLCIFWVVAFWKFFLFCFVFLRVVKNDLVSYTKQGIQQNLAVSLPFSSFVISKFYCQTLVNLLPMKSKKK
jgi:hypothetical protein